MGQLAQELFFSLPTKEYYPYYPGIVVLLVSLRLHGGPNFMEDFLTYPLNSRAR